MTLPTICFVCYHFRVRLQKSNDLVRNMFIFNSILIILSLCELVFADLKLCSEPQDKPSKKEAYICFTNKTGYSAPFPINLSLEVYFKNVIRIDEDLNLISIQAELWTYWTDPGLDLDHYVQE